MSRLTQLERLDLGSNEFTEVVSFALETELCIFYKSLYPLIHFYQYENVNMNLRVLLLSKYYVYLILFYGACYKNHVHILMNMSVFFLNLKITLCGIVWLLYL